MISSSVVFYKIATTCLLIFVGYLARRMKALPENSVAIVSKFIMYLAMPCYMVFYMPASISRQTIGAYWYYPLVGFGLLGLMDALSYGAARCFARPGERATFRLLASLPNWIFMAMAVCEPLFGEEGVRMVLLYNVGIMFYVWTLGMTSFRPSAGWRELLTQLFLNLQTGAILLGFALAMLFPALRGMERLPTDILAAMPVHRAVFVPLWETVHLVGSTALPLSIVQIGLLLGGERPGGEGSDLRSLVLASACRLVAAPVCVLGAQTLLCATLVPYNRNEFVASAIILSMPAATLCLTIADVYGGATRLAARGILWMTLASLVTVPAVTMAAQAAYRIL